MQDLGKVFLIFIAVLVVVTLGATLWMNFQLDEAESGLRTAKNRLNEIGSLVSGIQFLEAEKKKDIYLQYDTPNQYFAKLARNSGLDPNRDYETNPRSREHYEGYVDQEFNLIFKEEKSRERLGKFLVNIHSQSPRFRCVKAKLQLDPKRSEANRWKANFTILKRDPAVSEPIP